MNRLLLLPGTYRYHPFIDGFYRGDTTLTVPVYVVGQENGFSLIVLRADAPDLALWRRGVQETYESRAGAYFQVEDAEVTINLSELAEAVA